MKRLDKRGVSPVVGTVLMIVLTVVIATLVASYTLGLAGRAAGSAAVVEVRATKENENMINLKMIHRGGDPLRLSELIVYAQNENDNMVSVTMSGQTLIMPGMESSGVYTYGNKNVDIGMRVTIRVIHDPSGVLLFDASVIVKKK